MTGARIRELRLAAKISQGELAAEVGWWQSRLCAVERGNRPLDPDDYHRLVLAISAIVDRRAADYEEARRA